MQHLDEETLAGFVRDRVLNAAEGQGLVAERIAPVHLSQPNTRRRASLRAINGGGRPLIGFNEGGSHRVVDMQACHVLAPELFALVEPLRKVLSPRRDRYALEITLALTDQGVDCAIKGLALEGLAQTEAILDFCREQALARRPVDAVHRDLFRNPLRADALRGFDGVVLDPPRAGARDQILQLAESRVPRIAYVSCNPSSWARDGRILADAGYRLAELRPVGQFRWSTHVELASLFVL